MKKEHKSLIRKDGFQTLLASLVCVLGGLIVGYLVLLIIEPSGAFEAIVAVMKSFLRFPGALKLKYFGQALVRTAPLLLCAQHEAVGIQLFLTETVVVKTVHIVKQVGDLRPEPRGGHPLRRSNAQLHDLFGKGHCLLLRPQRLGKGDVPPQKALQAVSVDGNTHGTSIMFITSANPQRNRFSRRTLPGCRSRSLPRGRERPLPPWPHNPPACRRCRRRR